jgi:hypothetical protein
MKQLQINEIKQLPSTQAASGELETAIVMDMLQHSDPLKRYAEFHNLAKILDNALKNPLVKEQIESIIDLYPEKTFHVSTFEVQKKSRTALDYTVDMEYNKLKAAVKAREAFLKANKCNEDGLVIPDKTTDYFTIIAK